MEKSELIGALEDSRQEMLDLLEEVPDDEMLIQGVCGEWSIKDILAHVAQWEGQSLTLIYQSLQGNERPKTVHFGKETEEELNQRWASASRERPLPAIWQDWVGVRKQTIRRVSECSERDLNTPHRFAWLGDQALWEWIVKNVIDHEDEHADQIREWLERPRPGENGKQE